ncbi:(2Fe-2S)-binding protein [Paraburkholderia dipogonis]|uniref:(2Fe-2S)-binding protein n=1 Tax=Paraburkholderia dipogonis TaxID=1211383 RepID=A0A4Y8MJH6_9BURK|nr:(2Fe-2S)-binding protein [Paraburkholderia dipogonis]TFE37544.1 (2Fe-2S)-binding protein [Paraburkholderia dipogonis]
MNGRFDRLGETGRERVRPTMDGQPIEALVGDTVLTAILCSLRHVRQSEFGGENRAGFCLMGACQDCWVWIHDGERLRACTTVVESGMRIVTSQSGEQCPNIAS